MPRQVMGAAIAGLLVLAGWQLGGAALIHAKAWLAPILTERAWEHRLASGQAIPPWPWADTHPVGRLRVPSLDVERFVLAGTGGVSLAFGPGHIGASAAPGAPGHTVIAGHRDTHFRFLERLKPGDRLLLQGPGGAWRRYEVAGARIVDLREEPRLSLSAEDRLTLVTCWPFDAVDPNGPERYLVAARPVAD